MVVLLARHNIKVISLIHELPHLIQHYSAEGKARNIAEFADKIVFPSQYVYEKFCAITQLDHQKCHILPQGLFNHNPYKNNIAKARNELRKRLNLPLDSKIILGAGFADHRKGIEEIQDTLLIKNTIHNVSSVVFKNIDIKKNRKTIRKV